MATAVYLINRMPAKIFHFKTPLQILSTHISLPALLILHPGIFGCVAFFHLHKNQRAKLDPCVVRCLFLGYRLHKKGFKYYDPNTHRTYITMDVTFLQLYTIFPLQRETQVEVSNWLMANEIGNREVEQHEAPPESEPIKLRNEEQKNTEYPPSPHSSIPEGPPPPENVPKVSTPTAPVHATILDSSTGYVLPFRHNCKLCIYSRSVQAAQDFHSSTILLPYSQYC